MIELIIAAFLAFSPAKPPPYPTTAQANALRSTWEAPRPPPLKVTVVDWEPSPAPKVNFR